MNVVLFCIFCIFVLFFCFLISSLYCIMLICCLCSFWKCGAEDGWPTCCRPNLLIGTNNKTWTWTASMSAGMFTGSNTFARIGKLSLCFETRGSPHLPSFFCFSVLCLFVSSCFMFLLLILPLLLWVMAITLPLAFPLQRYTQSHHCHHCFPSTPGCLWLLVNSVLYSPLQFNSHCSSNSTMALFVWGGHVGGWLFVCGCMCAYMH